MKFLKFVKSLFKSGLKAEKPKPLGNTGLTYLRLPNIEISVGDWRWGTQQYPQFRYWCKCGEQLTAGPRGGAAVNAICKKCRINYGCLDYFEFE